MTGRTRGPCPSGKGSVVHIHHVMMDVSSVPLNPSRDFGFAMGFYAYALSSPSSTLRDFHHPGGLGFAVRITLTE
jgi:hypothetical protein